MFFYPSGISHSFVSSTRWRKFLWVLVGALDSHRAKLRRDSITVCCRFFLYDDNSLFSCQGQRKNFFFLLFCQDDEDDEGYFGSSLTFVGQILFCYARFVLSSAKISSLMRVGGSRAASYARKTTTLMNMSANVGEFLQKTTSRNPYKKPIQTMGNDNMQSAIHAIITF